MTPPAENTTTPAKNYCPPSWGWCAVIGGPDHGVKSTRPSDIACGDYIHALPVIVHCDTEGEADEAYGTLQGPVKSVAGNQIKLDRPTIARVLHKIRESNVEQLRRGLKKDDCRPYTVRYPSPLFRQFTTWHEVLEFYMTKGMRVKEWDLRSGDVVNVEGAISSPTRGALHDRKGSRGGDGDLSQGFERMRLGDHGGRSGASTPATPTTPVRRRQDAYTARSPSILQSPTPDRTRHRSSGSSHCVPISHTVVINNNVNTHDVSSSPLVHTLGVPDTIVDMSQPSSLSPSSDWYFDTHGYTSGARILAIATFHETDSMAGFVAALTGRGVPDKQLQYLYTTMLQ
ncbi:hypothetical protein EVJ58_g10763 [Rhodofomes roseus]|uniref:Uncharacterized protein n=1 Tax=Rhodofomes roseus TaxID=34475 RepID=A0A4Y9XP96_9APHY|nr:hypothetical protein EVJ58_g10763 [Rhodofomes roseus]